MEFEKELKAYLSAPKMSREESEALATAMSRDPKLASAMALVYDKTLKDAKSDEERREIHRRIQYLVAERYGAADFLSQAMRGDEKGEVSES